MCRGKGFSIVSSKAVPEVLDIKYNSEFKHGFTNPEAVSQRCSVKKDVIKNFRKSTRKHLYQSLLFNKVAETLAQVFSFEFFEISKNTFFIEHL